MNAASATAICDGPGKDGGGGGAGSAHALECTILMGRIYERRKIQGNLPNANGCRNTGWTKWLQESRTTDRRPRQPSVGPASCGRAAGLVATWDFLPMRKSSAFGACSVVTPR